MTERIAELCREIREIDERMRVRAREASGEIDDSNADWESLDHFDELQDEDHYQVRVRAIELVGLIDGQPVAPLP